MTPHSWVRPLNPGDEWHKCRRCGLMAIAPKEWREQDWEDNGVSEDCDEQRVRQVLES